MIELYSPATVYLGVISDKRVLRDRAYLPRDFICQLKTALSRAECHWQCLLTVLWQPILLFRSQRHENNGICLNFQSTVTPELYWPMPECQTHANVLRVYRSYLLLWRKQSSLLMYSFEESRRSHITFFKWICSPRRKLLNSDPPPPPPRELYKTHYWFPRRDILHFHITFIIIILKQTVSKAGYIHDSIHFFGGIREHWRVFPYIIISLQLI